MGGNIRKLTAKDDELACAIADDRQNNGVILNDRRESRDLRTNLTINVTVST